MNVDGNSCWLAPFEQESVLEALISSDAELIKWDNNRSLPLKKGGTTDIYINLRNARNDPRAISLLAEVYANPLYRFRTCRFVEIPDSVSCFAGSLAELTGIPYVTLREQAKSGRVSKAKMIGGLNRDESTIIIDDVITDGASKVIPIRECLEAGVVLRPLVVLVDRQQGWKKTFEKEGIDPQVWPGMTLHDVRKYLIENGLMERCSKEAEEKNPIIVALDGKSWDEILPIIDPLRTTGCIFKVNDLFFWEGGKNLIPDLEVYGRVMVDLKGHDIPNTISNIAKRLAKNPPWAVTIHASGGRDMIRAAVEAFKDTPTKVLAVTVLTSIDKNNCEEIYHRQPIDQVKQLAEIARICGAHGLVCSTEEVEELRPRCSGMMLVTPGVRSPGSHVGDQKRVGTPAGAIASGARHIVMGRQILGSEDPVNEVKTVLSEELKISL